MKEKNVYLDEETRDDDSESRLSGKTDGLRAPYIREECLYV